MTECPPKPRKTDFANARDFLIASAEWAEKWNVWPWGGPKDEDDEYYFVVTKSAPDFLGSLPSGESDPSAMLDCSGADATGGRCHGD